MKPGTTTKIISSIISCLIITCVIMGGYPESAFSAKSQRGLHIDTGRGKNTNKIIGAEGEEILLYKESHALVIGVSNYTNGWPSLPGVKKDVEAVTASLEAQGFNVVVHMDPDKSTLDRAFTEFISTYGQGAENRLLFYFAGHGHTVKTTYGEELGYVVPTDAPNPNYDLAIFQSKAMEMQQIEIYAKRIQSKHALFLFDACFSGSLFAMSRAIPEVISYKTAQPVRQFITSGSADETVPDESIFRTQFSRALQGEADSDQDNYVTGTELGQFLQTTVVNYSRNSQHPQYGKIRNPNLDKGDFVFALPRSEPEQAAVPTVEGPSEQTFSLEDLTEIAEQEKKAKMAWQLRLDEMEEAYALVGKYEQRDISKDLKIKGWQRFVESFSEENPYATRDNELLEAANQRIEYWDNYTVIPTPPKAQKATLRLNEVVITDASGKVIKPYDDIYSIRRGETVAIDVDIASSNKQRLEAAWTTGRGKVPASDSTKNTYTPTKLGSDYVTVFVWDPVTGAELPEIPINITVVPLDAPEVTPRVSTTDSQFSPSDVPQISQEAVSASYTIAVKDAYGKRIHPMDDIYTIKKRETVTITVNMAPSQGHKLEFAWTTGRGRVPQSDQKTNIYTATELGPDYVTVYIWDAVTGKEIVEVPINFTVVSE